MVILKWCEGGMEPEAQAQNRIITVLLITATNIYCAPSMCIVQGILYV